MLKAWKIKCNPMPLYRYIRKDNVKKKINVRDFIKKINKNTRINSFLTLSK